MRIWRRFWKELVTYTQLRSGSSGAGNMRGWLARPPASKCLILIINFAPKQSLAPLFPKELECLYILIKCYPSPSPGHWRGYQGMPPAITADYKLCLRNWNIQAGELISYGPIKYIYPIPTGRHRYPDPMHSLTPGVKVCIQFNPSHQINKILVHEVQCINLQSSRGAV